MLAKLISTNPGLITIREPINRINNSIRTMFDKMTLADITFK